MKKILISGASIAGPALAFVLSRRGWQVTVVERAPLLRAGGYAIDVRGAALEVVARLGLEPAMRAAGTDTQSTHMIDARDRRLATFARGFGVISPEDIEILRGDLAQLMYAATRADVRYLFDDSITALVNGADGVDVTFARNPSERFDYVVGADGLHSNVRALAFGPEDACVRGLGSAVAIFTAANHAGLDRAQIMMMAPRRIVSIKSDRGNATVKAAFIFHAPSLPDRRDVAAQRRLVHDAFADLGAPVAPLLADLATAPDFYFDGVSQTRLESWRRERVLLVGDAAYGPSLMTGQGTSLALIGAYELASALAEEATPSAVGARYERLRP
ncbi:MAG TPA: FAD-dependent monooxygenase, partial [Polyangia bacterium]|nr:FAD-dependent monooxygenase [Polyangia bacterium]